MVFIHPEFLWGLLAMLIPIIIHLFDFRKNRKVYFPDISFLKQVKHSSKKPLKLKQWLILISRLAFVFFLVMVFAKPILPTDSKKQLRAGTKLIYIDNSQSMSALTSSNKSLIDIAKSISQQIVTQLPKGQEIIVLENDNLGRIFSSISLTDASQKISTITLSDKPFSLNKLELAIANYSKREILPSDVFIISDFQKSTSWVDSYRADSAITYWLSPLVIESANNCVVDSVFMKNSDITIENVQIEVVINNSGNQLKENLPVKVFLGNRQVSAATVSIPPFQQKSISFSLGEIKQHISGYIQLEDYPNTFDNLFYFSLPEKRLLQVFEIRDEHSSDYIKPVFGNSDIFSISTNNYQNIDNYLFEKADFVILNEVESPSLELIEKIKNFAVNGGAVLVIPNPAFSLVSYRHFSNTLNVDIRKHRQKLKAPSSQSPFFSHILEKSSRSFEMPTIKPVWSWGQDRSAILSLEDGTPYLSELANNIFFLRGSLIDSLSSFQSHALFVPIMYSLASQSTTPANNLFYRIDEESYDIKDDSIELRDLIKLQKEAIEIVPDKRKDGNNWRLSFLSEIKSTGVYEIKVDNELKGYLPLNLTNKESLLTPMNTEDIRALFNDYNYNFLETYNPNRNILSSFDSGIALWKYALTICLLFLLTETLLIRFL